MNFRPTALKTAVSIIFWLIVGYILSRVVFMALYLGDKSAYSLSECTGYGFIAGLVVYLIWSLFQKKK